MAVPTQKYYCKDLTYFGWEFPWVHFFALGGIRGPWRHIAEPAEARWSVATSFRLFSFFYYMSKSLWHQKVFKCSFFIICLTPLGYILPQHVVCIIIKLLVAMQQLPIGVKAAGLIQFYHQCSVYQCPRLAEGRPFFPRAVMSLSGVCWTIHTVENRGYIIILFGII